MQTQRLWHHWRGNSGQRYAFSLYAMDEDFDFEGIVYLVCRAEADGAVTPLYAGQTGQGGARLRGDARLAAARSSSPSPAPTARPP